MSINYISNKQTPCLYGTLLVCFKSESYIETAEHNFLNKKKTKTDQFCPNGCINDHSHITTTHLITLTLPKTVLGLAQLSKILVRTTHTNCLAVSQAEDGGLLGHNRCGERDHDEVHEEPLLPLPDSSPDQQGKPITREDWSVLAWPDSLAQTVSKHLSAGKLWSSAQQYGGQALVPRQQGYGQGGGVGPGYRG